MEKSVSKMKSTGFFLPVTVPTRAIAMAAIAIAGSAGRRIASQGGGLNPEGFGISSGKLGYLPRKYLIGFLFGVSFCLLLKTITNNYTVCTYEYVCIGTYVHVKKGKVVNLNQKPHSKRPELQLRMH